MAKLGDLLGESYAPDCPGRDVLDHVVSKWGMLVMLALGERTYRYAELRRRIGGVSERMLALTLRTLEEDGFVSRRDFGEVPPRVEYSLTPMGRQLAEHLEALGRWIATNTPKVLAARARHQRATKRAVSRRAS
jgi:DNA-binding HxlR family transcriptional regulator